MRIECVVVVTYYYNICTRASRSGRGKRVDRETLSTRRARRRFRLSRGVRHDTRLLRFSCPDAVFLRFLRGVVVVCCTRAYICIKMCSKITINQNHFAYRFEKPPVKIEIFLRDCSARLIYRPVYGSFVCKSKIKKSENKCNL